MSYNNKININEIIEIFDIIIKLILMKLFK